MKETIKLLFALINDELFSHPLPEAYKQPLTEEVLASLYTLADKHDLAHVVAGALYRNRLLPKGSDTAGKFQRAQVMALYRYTKLEHEYKQITQVLRDAEIPYIPLKGVIIRPFYPQPHLRTSCDIDILVHREDLEKAAERLTTVLNYTWDKEIHYHDISLFSPSGFHLELHFSINENRESMDQLLAQVWKYSKPISEGSFEYRQTPEFFMFHQIAHMAYHFLSGGCGIRPLVDLYLLRQKMPYDEALVQALCDQCDIGIFYERVKELSEIWFGDLSHNALTLQMEAYVIHGGVYGNLDNSVAVKRTRSSSGFSYVMSRIFMPYELLKTKYAVLNKHKWLYPFMTVRRWFELLSPTKRRRAATELKKNHDITDDDQRRMHDFLQALGLS